MELPVSTSLLSAVSRASLCPNASECSFKGYLFRLDKNRRRLSCYSKPLRVELSLDQNSSPNGNQKVGNIWEDSNFVEVIGIGSRKDAILDFCLDSPLHSSALRFWNITVKESVNVQLQQRFIGEDNPPNIVEAPSALQSCSKALILVAGAAYGSEHIMALDILKKVNSVNGLVVGIILKPFSFEGQRRRDEVKALVDKLKEFTNFCIMVDTDALLEKDVLTLDEALKTANNAVLMAVNAISILVSEMHIKLLDVPNDTVKEINVSELKKFLGSYRAAKIGFGTGYNIEASIMRAIYDCPFLGVDVKDLSTIAVCVLASSRGIDMSDVHAVLHAFRQSTECKGAMIMSIVHEPNLEPNLIATTVIALGCTGHEASHKGGIFSRLVQHFPFIFNLLGKQHSESFNRQEGGSENGHFSEVIDSPDSDDMPNMTPAIGTTEDFGIYSAELETLFSSSGDEMYSLRGYGSSLEQSDSELSEVDSESDFSKPYDPDIKGTPTFQRELLLGRHNIGPGYAQEWAGEEANNSAATPVFDNLGIYRLPIGVKSSEELKVDSSIIVPRLETEKLADIDMKAEPQVTPSIPWDALTDASYEVVTEFYSNASALLKGNNADVSKKQGNLSARAASMLEAERDSSKKWSPIVEIKYRGGLYMGRCQGGLPEGKGRLALEDGSIYDGIWRYGKRSGLGTFCFSNGDVFQGSWRDDVMHGKGWLYFRTGDRWFVNFWKGKANGEGRFYSSNGEIFFGHFKDGWRHGHFLCINVNGERCLEIWDEGVLVSRKQLDSDADAE